MIATFHCGMSKQIEANNKDPDTLFCQGYSTNDVNANQIADVLNRIRDTVRNLVFVPFNNVVVNYERFTYPSYCNYDRNRESETFYQASMALAEFLALLTNLVHNGAGFNGFYDKIRPILQNEWTECARCPHFQRLAAAAFGIVTNDQELIDKFLNADTLCFLAETLLLQGRICQTRSFQVVLEVFGDVFVFQLMSCQYNIIRKCIEDDRKLLQDGMANFDSSVILSFLKLITTISRFRDSSDFAHMLYQNGSEVLHFASSFIVPKPFSISVSAFASLIKNKELADIIYQRFNDSISDVMNIRRFYLAIKGHASDMNTCEIDRRKLSSEDTKAIESILELSQAMFYHSADCRKSIASNPEYDLINSLFQLILSPIPATLKARCFDCLSSLSLDEQYLFEIWGQLDSCQILTDDQIECGTGGIISDIEETEVHERTYPLLRSFVRFLSFLFIEIAPPIKIDRFHMFLFEHCLMKIQNRIFNNINEKWSMICEVSQCWTNLSKFPIGGIKPFLRTALCDQRFIRCFISYVSEQECPLETLFCVFRMFLLIIDRESCFTQNMDSSDHSSYVAFTKQLSWSSSVLKRIILCIGELDRDLQITCITLAQRLAESSPSITQVVFSCSEAHAIRSFKRCIERDESEDDSNCYNVRNALLCFLNSLTGSSYFVRHVCGFDVSDAPRSLLKSTLEKGILTKIVSKIISTEAVKNYPRFSSLSLILMLNLCDSIYTVTPTLNFLRSSSLSFFEKLLNQLQNERSSKTSIGNFLCLLSRESHESCDKQSNGKTVASFKALFGNDNYYVKNRRVVLVFEFVDRIEDDSESSEIVHGLFEVCASYLSNKGVLSVLHENSSSWITIFVELIDHLMECCKRTTHQITTEYITKTISFVGNFLFFKGMIGQVDSQVSLQVLNNALKTLNYLYELQHNDSRLGLYSLISYIFGSIKNHNSGLNSCFSNHMVTFENIVMNDMNHESPIVKSSVFAAIESMISLFTGEFLEHFIEVSISQLSTDWLIFEEDCESGAFVLTSKFSMFSRFASSHQRAAFLINCGLIPNITYLSFWSGIAEFYSTSTTNPLSEIKMNIASKAIKILTSLVIHNINNSDLYSQLYDFLSKVSNALCAVLDFGGLFTVKALYLLDDLCSLCTVIQWSRLSDNFTIPNKLRLLKSRFLSQETWRELIRKRAGYVDTMPSQKVIKEAEKVVQHIVKVLEVFSKIQ